MRHKGLLTRWEFENWVVGNIEVFVYARSVWELMFAKQHPLLLEV